MSNYRSYGWNKGTTSSSNYTNLSKKDATTPKYESSYTRPRIEIKKPEEDKSSSSRLGSKYSSYSSGYQRDSSATRDTGSYSSRSNISNLRILDKKDSLHPPVSYRPISKTGAISRETSPSSVSSSTPASYSTNRLYPESYNRGTSRERTESTSPSSTIPKYTGRSNTTKEIIPLARSGRNESKEDLSNRYRGSKTTSREDLSGGPQKYITSRFLPKNTVEKSYTAYTRPSAVRVSEACRKNRELLNVIAAQHEQEKLSRPVSRCSSTTPEDTSKSTTTTTTTEPTTNEEMESVSVVTRSTSPLQLNPVSVSRTRRVDVAKTVEKVITRPKKKMEAVDKEIQSDRMDDTARYSRFANSSSRTAATPWSSFLDMKFSSPGDNQKTAKTEQDISSQSEKTESTSKTQSNKSSKEGSASPRNMSRSNSIKNLSRSFSKLDMKGKDSRSPTPTSQTKPKASKSSDKKQLPPQIPKSENNSKSSGPAPNKDFRKSVLNMNYEGKSKKTNKRSNSVSSADSGSEAADTTDISENLTSCPSYHKSNSSSSKLPQRVSAENSRRSCTRSPSIETNSSSSSQASGSEDDQSKKSKQKKRPTAFSPDELSSEKCPKPPLSPRVKNETQRSEVEAKSFLMRALAPVTSLFKVRHIDSSDKINWMDSSPENSPEHSKQIVEEEKPQKKTIQRIESGEKAWWMEEDKQTLTPEEKIIKKTLRHTDSAEKAWWMDENAEVPSGVEQYTSESQEDNSGYVYKVRHNDSDNKDWWLSTSSDNANDKSASENAIQPESLQQYRLRHIDSGERAWWFSSTENLAENTNQQQDNKPMYKIRHQESGEKAWWMNQQKSDDESDDELIPLGDRASPEGLETPRDEELQGRRSPYDNVPQGKAKRPTHIPLFISRHTNIDDILGGTTQLLSPLMDTIFSYRKGLEEYEEIDPSQVKIHEGKAERNSNSSFSAKVPSAHPKLDDAALQLYKDGDYGSYLDLEASISEQQEEFEGFQSNKKNSIVLRTQLSVRVHTIIEKLLTSEGRELRRALFSLKQIFQEDKDLVHEFVQNDGLACLIKVGSVADQNYQNYILRALGQVMLYVDGMNGVIQHNETVQWLYTLISSKFRLVVKTALKLLLVFAEYTDSNCMLLVKAINTVDCSQGFLPWHNVMKLLKDFDSADTELLIYATTLINKVLNGIPDQDTYYDQTDALEEQGIEGIIQRYMAKPGTDLDLLQQFQIYEAVLQYEDGEEKCAPIRHLDENIRKTLRSRKSLVASTERRKSRRHSTGTTPLNGTLNNNRICVPQPNLEVDDESSSTHSSDLNNINGSYKENNKAKDAGVTPALRRRRERAERQRSFMKEQQESVALLRNNMQNSDDYNEDGNGNYTNALQQRITNGNLLNRNSSKKDLTPLMNAVNKLESEESLTKQPWILSMMYNKSTEDQNEENISDNENTNENERKMLLQLKRENTVKDLTQKLASQNILHSPSEESKVNRIGDMSGLISKAKEGLAKSKSKADVLKSPTGDNIPKVVEVKKSENELRWEELMASLNRPLNLCDMDFTDLASDDEVDVLAPTAVTNGIPPPPPPLMKENGMAPPPPPLANRIIPPPVPTPPMFMGSAPKYNNKPAETKIPIKKNKKTVKLFWKEVREDPISSMKLKSGLIWDELNPVAVDTQKLEHLFESRAKDLLTKKQQEMNKNKEVIVLDPKRSNAINIGMTKLPPPRSIKTAILKMDATIMNREGIEKLLTMLPTEEETTKIQDAQAANPDLPLGSAEQFLLTLASISELPARLKLWAFKLDFENSEREIAEPLMDLKQGFEVLRVNKTFRGILSTLLSIGNFLNGNEVKGFQIEYLAKVPEVKDTVHKHSLLHHLCHIVMEKFPDATDLYSEIGAITRASKIDFDELSSNIQHLEADCKASWDHLKLIAKHDGSTMMKVKMSDFLADCAERIILLGIIHRRIMNRFHKFLLWLGIPLHQISDTKPNEFCRVVSEFALEYRTTRERVLQQLEKKANHRERNKTRGKMITEIGKFRTKEDRADAELRQLLGSDMSDVESLQGTLPWRRQKRDGSRSIFAQANGNLTDDGDDEILESLVKTATKGPSRTAPRERKRTRHADRKSLRRTLKNGLSEEEKKHLSTYIKGY